MFSYLIRQNEYVYEKKLFKFWNYISVWQDAHTLSGITPTMGVMTTPQSRRFADTPLCLHKRVELGNMAIFIHYHDIERSTWYASNEYITTFKNSLLRDYFVTTNVNSEKMKIICLNLDHTVIQLPFTLGLQFFVLNVGQA